MDLIDLYGKLGQNLIAEREANALFSALEQSLGLEDSLTLHAAYTLAGILLEVDKAEEAAHLSQRLLVVRVAKYGKKQPITLVTSVFLAAVY
jgi:hypothetical protein